MPRDLGSEPAFPTEWDSRHSVGYFRGMTKREVIAALALAGILANHGDEYPDPALAAWAHADDLLATAGAPKEE